MICSGSLKILELILFSYPITGVSIDFLCSHSRGNYRRPNLWRRHPRRDIHRRHDRQLYPFDMKFLGETAPRIINEVKGVNGVVYDVTSGPPGTIRWE